MFSWEVCKKREPPKEALFKSCRSRTRQPRLDDRWEADDQIDCGDDDGDDHNGERSLEEADEGDLVTVLLGDVGHDHVGGGADKRSVSPEASTERHSPPKRGDIHARCRQGQQDGAHCCHEGDVVKEGGDDCAAKQQDEHGEEHVASRDADEALGKQLDGSCMLERADDDEEASEEGQRGPFHLGQGELDAAAGDKQKDAGSSHCDNAGLQTEGAMEHKAQDDDDHHDDALDQQGLALDLLALIELHDSVFVFLVDMHLAAVDEVENGDEHNQDQDDGGCVYGDEVEEGQSGLGTDHDVGGIADKRCGTADVGRQDLSHKERDRIDVEQLAYRQRHGAYKQDRGDVVEEGGENRGQNDEQHHNRPRVALRNLCALDGEVFEHSRLPDNGNKQHHSEQNTQGVEVDGADSELKTGFALFCADLGEDEDHQKDCSDDGNEGAMYLFADDERQCHHKNDD